jgi:hypothetical protein
VQTPTHAPALQAWSTHGAAACSVPAAVQVMGVTASAHARAPGTQEPVHVPAVYAWPTHAVSTCHAPVASHVSGVTASAHASTPGVHATHAPVRHTGSDVPHGAAGCHVPVASHVSTAFAVVAEHCVAPGKHAPTHAPFTQA